MYDYENNFGYIRQSSYLHYLEGYPLVDCIV